MLANFINKHDLPESFVDKAKRYFIPLAESIFERTKQKKAPLFIGINGCQGAGKTTLTDFLSEYLNSAHQLTVVNLSLDDFYLSKQARAELAKNVHPLLATRGVPGTHNIDLLSHTLVALNKQNAEVKLSKFNKATDDLVPETLWPLAPRHIDIVLLEGWCWGVSAQQHEQLTLPINDLEATQDIDGQWRNYVNQQLIDNYQPLYGLIDAWLMLKAPSFKCVEKWRWQQEEKLAQYNHGDGVMNKQQVHNFIQYFQRLTEESLKKLPLHCDWILPLNENRELTEIRVKDTTLQQPLIFTDLDATLLDHFDYSFTDAAALINALNIANIPIIPNTSKTRAELTNIRAEMNLTSPFIIENGAAVYIPIGYFKTQPDGTYIEDSYWVKEFCPERSHWLTLLNNRTEKFKGMFEGFSTLDLDELVHLTGLTPENAILALNRKYTEPLLWHSDNQSKLAFIAHMESLGAHMLQGGRFLHVGGHSNKGAALTWLANVYADNQSTDTKIQTIALGDSHNDNEMLEIADIAIQIKSPIHPFPVLNKTDKCFKSTELGPKGWAECLSNLLVLPHPSLKKGTY